MCGTGPRGRDLVAVRLPFPEEPVSRFDVPLAQFPLGGKTQMFNLIDTVPQNSGPDHIHRQRIRVSWSRRATDGRIYEGQWICASDL